MYMEYKCGTGGAGFRILKLIFTFRYHVWSNRSDDCCKGTLRFNLDTTALSYRFWARSTGHNPRQHFSFLQITP